MLARYRRFWFVVAVAVLAVPLCVQLIEPRDGRSLAEGRLLAEPPNWPTSMGDLAGATAQTRSFLNDHFGLRDVLISANAMVRYALYSTDNPEVTLGRDRRLFLTDDFDIQQSAGLLVRYDRVARFAAFVAKLDAQFRQRNIAFLFAAPPNATTILRQYVFFRRAAAPAATEYDLVLRSLAQRGVPALDLRPTLAAGQSHRETYRRTDTHWNDLGALIAYNAVVSALGSRDWTIDSQRVVSGDVATTGGDLARMLGLAGTLSEKVPLIDMSSYSPPPLLESPASDFLATSTTGRSGPVVVVIGDSFTHFLWQKFFALHVSQLVWVANRYCQFTPDEVEMWHPDIVIFAPTERFMFCAPSVPVNVK